MDKLELVSQLQIQLRNQVRGAGRSAVECAAEAQNGATAKDKSTDSRVAIEYASMARAQKQRAERVFGELKVIEGFKPPSLSERSAVCVGAVIEIEDAETSEGRTFFLAPVGAGITLSGPDGDGHLSVVTPHSPIGRAVLGRRVGDIIDVTVKGDVREWEIVYIG